MASGLQLTSRQLVTSGCGRPRASHRDMAATSALTISGSHWLGGSSAPLRICPLPHRHGVRAAKGGGTGGTAGQWETATWHHPVVCQASESEVVSKSRSMQLSATAVLTELLKADDLAAAVEENLDNLNEEFFTIASTYVDIATKEGNQEVVGKLQSTLKAAMDAKQKTLRPEIQLLNSLLAQKTSSQRIPIIQSKLEYLDPDSYFFQILNRFTLDVERQPDNAANKNELLVQLRSIARETKEASKGIKKKEKSPQDVNKTKRGFGQ